MNLQRDPGLEGAVPFRFACSRGGHCCSGGNGYAWVELDEIEALAETLAMTSEAFSGLHLREARDPRTGVRRPALRERDDGRCTLLEGRNTCRAYDARPRHCRDFPYWPSVMKGGDGFEAARSACPGIAVVVDPDHAEPAFARLARLYAELDDAPRGERASAEPSDCCSDTNRADDLYMSALEADYAARNGGPESGCRLGPARPLGCRMSRSGEAECAEARALVRAIERETNYPPAYGEARALLRARGVTREDAP